MEFVAESQKTFDTGRDFQQKFPSITGKPENFHSYNWKRQLQVIKCIPKEQRVKSILCYKMSKTDSGVQNSKLYRFPALFTEVHSGSLLVVGHLIIKAKVVCIRSQKVYRLQITDSKARKVSRSNI